jgi:enamine deaminase RidA (YjgF/YER057c/UK114 family)
MNKPYSPDTMPPPASRYSQLVEVPGGSRLVVLSGQVGLRPDGTAASGFEAQAAQVFENILAGLAAIGMGPADLVRLNSYVTRAEDVGKLRAIRDRYMDGHQCASTLVIVAGLASPDWLVEIEAIAAAG